MPDVSLLRPEDPRHLGNYRLDGRLGAGGQGVVFRGTAPSGVPVAVKLLHARLDGTAARRAFAREIEAVRRVAPFCTAQVLDADLDGDRPYVVSEYVDGPSLREHVTAAGPRTGGDLDRVAVGTATALAAIHRAGIVHRDFKPGNVLLGSDGLRVVDFGISRLADATATTGNLVGTPAYMAPEQLQGRSAGPAADVFCWALTLVYAASGRHAYTGDTHAAVMARILYGMPDLGPLAGLLKDLVVACLAADPADRPDAGQVLSALLDRPSPGRPGPPGRAGQGMTAPGPGGSAASFFAASGSAVSGSAVSGSAVSGSTAPPRQEPGATSPGARADTGQIDTSQTDTSQADTGQADTGQADTGRTDVDESDTEPTGREPADTEPASLDPTGSYPTGLGPTSPTPTGPTPTGSAPISRTPTSPERTSTERTSTERTSTERTGTEPGGAEGVLVDRPTELARPGGRGRGRARAVIASLVLLVAVVVAAGVAWVLTNGEPGRESVHQPARLAGRLDGTWTGVARYPSAGRIFPVEIRLTTPARMRWGADLHCSGRLTPARESGETLVLTLDQVKGDACYPGSVSITWRGDTAADFAVTREGERDARYSGSLSHTN
ncbi:serine/threonine-protein kinase [Microbispora hainanensis]|uniref:Serine/threonine protein kinase n=1 Tax=Microbispora hainanensis TaxID=568844 RepID=A0ABZ1SHX4_9ACTN|nr:serine/threonine-protein kinase [Microbispora hainanensis]